MQLEISTLCSHAEDFGGRLCIAGVFDTIHAPQFPAQHPHCAVAVRLRFQRSEEGLHTIRIMMIDQDGRNHGPKLDGQIPVKVPDDSESVAVNQVLGIIGLPIPHQGTFHIDIAIDGQLVTRLPLFIKPHQSLKAAA